MSTSCVSSCVKKLSRASGLLFVAFAVWTVFSTVPAVAQQSQNPLQAMKDAWKKAKEQAKQQQRGQTPQQPVNGQPGNAHSGASGGNSVPSKLPRSSAHVEPQLMASNEAGAAFVVSSAAHFASVAHRGSRMVVLYDGTEGPKFDEIVTLPSASQRPVIFSPDGTRYAYVARSGPQKIVIVDGKEIVRFDEANTDFGGRNGLCEIEFTPNSKHYFFRLHPTSTDGHESSKARLYWDGVPGPEYAEDPIISPDGDHYAYYLRQPTANGDIVHLMIDGKPAGYMGGNPQFTFDGKHLFTAMNYSRPTAYTEVLLDGKPIMKATAVQLYMPPAGYNFVAVLGTGIGTNYRFLVVGNRKIEGSECRGSSGYDEITFSADGKHWAARCQSRPGFWFVEADGKRGQEYGGVSQLKFTADGSVTYFASQGRQNYVVIGDQESEAYDALMSAQPDNLPNQYGPSVIGEHLGYISSSPGQQGAVMHVDGKTWSGRGVGQLQFSPDGKHFAFVVYDGGPGRGGKLVLDGVEQPGTYMDIGMETNIKGEPHMVTFVFSPDSTHIAWYGTSPADPTGSGVFVDGKYIHASEPGITPLHVSFTPDSKHLMYAAIVRGESGTQYGIFVDGRIATTVDFTQLMRTDSAWQWGEDGTLTVFGQDADGMKRLRIKPAEDTTIATLTGGGSGIAQAEAKK